jgi:hypothetical protein
MLDDSLKETGRTGDLRIADIATVLLDAIQRAELHLPPAADDRSSGDEPPGGKATP